MPQPGMTELFTQDPSNLSDEDVIRIIETYREKRRTFKKEASAPKPKAAPKPKKVNPKIQGLDLGGIEL